jgi:hypothetical protein
MKSAQAFQDDAICKDGYMLNLGIDVPENARRSLCHERPSILRSSFEADRGAQRSCRFETCTAADTSIAVVISSGLCMRCFSVPQSLTDVLGGSAFAGCSRFRVVSTPRGAQPEGSAATSSRNAISMFYIRMEVAMAQKWSFLDTAYLR